MTTKLCTKCNTIKSTTEFHKDRTSKDGLCFCCIECKKIYREKNKESISKYHKEYREKNKEILNKRSKEYQNKYKYKHKHKQDKEYYKKYYEKNKQKISERIKKYHIDNKERMELKQKIYKKTESAKISIKNTRMKRRTIKKQGDVTSIQLSKLLEDAKSCYWCNTSLKGLIAHIDHYIPISKGGQHTLSNLVVSCPHCNHIKSSKDPYAFANSLGRLI